ncbi:MAG TPA: N,N-dimethylformamidase beta subunit family domain-containing protein [Rhizomicrobium sp.]|nr:N,N-dimethylformamidase beta subunit family domain-containing protein [Rhizomicrobium sp.]
MINFTRRTSILMMGVASAFTALARLPAMALTSLTARPRRAVTDADKGHALTLAKSNKTVVGYSDQITVRPGEKITFHVSTYAPGDYKASLVRVINGDSLSGAGRFRVDPVAADFARSYPGSEQKTWPGSYVTFDTASPSGIVGSKQDFSVVALIKPTLPGKGPQFVASQWDQTRKTGWAIGIDERGEGALWVGQGGGRFFKLRTSRFIQPNHWTMLGASFDAASGEWRVYDVLLTDPNFTLESPTDPWHYIFGTRRLARDWTVATGTPMRFGAGSGEAMANGQPAPVALFNGRIDGVRISGKVLHPTDMIRVATATKLDEVSGDDVRGFWSFGRGIGTLTVYDATAAAWNGRGVNWPQRAMKGYHWKSSTDWRKQPDEFSAMYFREDDLLDAEWTPSFSYTVPKGLRSGIYAVHLQHGTSEHYVPFFVAPPKGIATAPTAFLIPTTTYLAYTNWTRNFAQLERYPAFHFNADDIDFLMQHPEFGRGLYDQHIDGTLVTRSSWRRPLLTVTLKTWLHLINSDTQIVDWLEHEKLPYDIITDDLVHKEGKALLSRYRTVITGQHPEYQSPEIFTAVKDYMSSGGRFMYLGGNGFQNPAAWRNDGIPAVELRRLNETYWTPQNFEGERRFELNGVDNLEWDHSWLTHNLGLKYAGTTFGSGNTYYKVLPDSKNQRAAFIFAGVTSEIIGDYGTHFGGAAGDEFDRLDYEAGTPRHALHLAKSEGTPLPVWATGQLAAKMRDDYDNKSYASIIFFETPSGGAVFSVGSMAYIGALNHNSFDNDIARISTNVLKRFSQPQPFKAPI